MSCFVLVLFSSSSLFNKLDKQLTRLISALAFPLETHTDKLPTEYGIHDTESKLHMIKARSQQLHPQSRNIQRNGAREEKEKKNFLSLVFSRLGS